MEFILLIVNMIRNDDRLYHIVVSFPSICAKQFLIFKFKRNEAICCLIGFGIGIGCCLMFRWLKNTFFKMNLITTTTSTSASISNSRRLCRLAAAAFEDSSGVGESRSPSPFHRRYFCCSNHPPNNLFSSSDIESVIGRDQQQLQYEQQRDTAGASAAGVFNNTINNFNTFNNNANSPSLKKRNGKSTTAATTTLRMRKGDRLSRSSSQIKELLNNKSDKSSRSPTKSRHNKYTSFDSYLQLKYMAQPINDIYQNLAKFLTRNFCKSIKVRRSMSGCKPESPSSTRNRLNALFKQMRPVSSPPASTTNQEPTRNYIHHPKDYYSSTSSSSGIINNVSTPTNSSYLPPVRSRTVSNSAAVLSDTMIASTSTNATITSSNERLSRSNTHLDLSSRDVGEHRFSTSSGRDIDFFDNRSTTSIDQLFFPAGSSSCLGSTFDIDFSIDSKAHDNMSIHSGATQTSVRTQSSQHQVDKSLDEALQHIDKLKEDMNHLCKDLDTLYSRRIIYDHAFYLTSASASNEAAEAFKSSSTNSVNLWGGDEETDNYKRPVSSSSNNKNDDSFTHYQSKTSLAAAELGELEAVDKTSGVGSHKCTQQTQTSPKRTSTKTKRVKQQRVNRLGRCWCRHGCGQVYRPISTVNRMKKLQFRRVNEESNKNNDPPSLDEI